MKPLSYLAAVLLLLPLTARAELEIGAYGGVQTSPHSIVTITGDSVIADTTFTAGWLGRSFAMPPYWGIRATWWNGQDLGFGLEFNHAKVYADAETLAATGFERLEFSDGQNILTANLFRRWPEAFGAYTPYAGLGLGIAIPHVELTTVGSMTFEYQYAGPAAAWVIGASRPISTHWGMFIEYRGTYSWNSVTLTTGGTLQTNLVTNAVNLGISYSF